MIEVVSLFLGAYLGWKHNQKIKIFITALTGANLGVFGTTLSLKLQPIHNTSVASIVLYILSIVIIFLIGFIYQKYQMKKFNQRISVANNSLFEYGLSEDERRNNKLDKITSFLKKTNYIYMNRDSVQ